MLLEAGDSFCHCSGGYCRLMKFWKYRFLSSLRFSNYTMPGESSLPCSNSKPHMQRRSEHKRIISLTDAFTRLSSVFEIEASILDCWLVGNLIHANLQRYPRPEKEYKSFSLIYDDMSLDLICKDKDEAEVWFTGLEALIPPKVHMEKALSDAMLYALPPKVPFPSDSASSSFQSLSSGGSDSASGSLMLAGLVHG